MVVPLGAWAASDDTLLPSNQELELEVIQKKIDALKTLLDSGIGVSAVQPAGKEPKLKFGGLLQVQGDAGDMAGQFPDNQGRVYLRRARLNAAGSFLENFSFRMETEWSGSLTTKSLTPALTDGYVDWTAYQECQIRAGQFKTPFGFEQLAADPTLLTIERSLANDRLTLNRQLGAQASGSFLEKRISYAGGVFNGTSVNTALNDNKLFMGVARVSARPVAGKLVGSDASVDIGWDFYGTRDNGVTLTGLSVPTTLFTGFRQGRSADLQARWGVAEFWGEWIMGHYQPATKNSIGVKAQGGYAQLTAYVIPKLLQAVGKVDYFDPNQSKGWDITRTLTAGANYYIKGNDLKLQFDYLRIKTEGVKLANKFVLRQQVMF